MDDKIKQLLKQAEAHEILDTRGFANRYHYAMTQASIEKFVSLIVEECAQRAEAYAYMSPNFDALAKEIREIKP